MDDALLVLDGLGKDFGGTTALRSLTCGLPAGCTVGLLGPNGAGKTTTIKLVLGMLRPSRGRAVFDGLDCTNEPLEVKRRIGYSPDEPAFFDYLTGRETIDFAIGVRGVGVEPAWERAYALAESLQFTESLNEPVGAYSHGTKKKLALILAICHAPKMLLLDEPTNGLDPPAAFAVKEVLRRQAAEGTLVLLSTHHLAMADGMCDRIVILNNGEAIADGTPEGIRTDAGLDVDATLEEAFMKLVA